MNQDMFLEPQYLPSSLKLLEISKMKTEELHACLRHWSERTENGKVAFRFKTVKEGDLRGSSSKKRRPAPPSDEEDGDQDKDADLQGSPLKKKRPASRSDVEHGEDQLDQDDASEAAEVTTGKGKAKAMLVMWYDCMMCDH